MDRVDNTGAEFSSLVSGWGVEADIQRAKGTGGIRFRYLNPEGAEVVGIDFYDNFEANTPAEIATTERIAYLCGQIARFLNAGGTLDQLNDLLFAMYHSPELDTDNLPVIDNRFELVGTWQAPASVRNYYYDSQTERIVVIDSGVYAGDMPREQFSALVNRGELRCNP